VLADTDLDLCDTVVFRVVGICLYSYHIHVTAGLYESPLTTSTLTNLHGTRIAVKCHVVGSEAHVQHRFTGQTPASLPYPSYRQPRCLSSRPANGTLDIYYEI